MGKGREQTVRSGGKEKSWRSDDGGKGNRDDEKKGSPFMFIRGRGRDKAYLTVFFPSPPSGTVRN